MKTNVKGLPEDSIIAGSESKFFARFNSRESGKSDIKSLRGILKSHENKYSTLELEEKASEWRVDVSD